MKIQIENDRILIKSIFRRKFDALSFDIESVVLWGERKANWPFNKKIRRYNGSNFLRFIMIASRERKISLDSLQDSGFDSAFSWLKKAGWDMDNSLIKALEFPLIRVYASKLG